MVCSPPIGPEIVRGSITRDRWVVTLRFSYASEVPCNQRSHFYLKVDWQPDRGNRDIELTFRPQTATSGQIVFNDANGPNTRRFSGDVEQLVAIYGKTQSAQGTEDITLEVRIDDEVRHRIPLAVRPVPSPVPAATAFERLRQEMAIAALATRPTDAAQQRIWDRYTQIYDDARAIADKLGSVTLPIPVVPTIQGTLIERSLNGAEIIEHLRSHRSANGVANRKAKNRTDAFDPFKGHWRGDWRQANDCGIPVNTCQDHLWGATTPLSTNRDIYVQQVELGADSRPYTDVTPTRTCTAITDVGRDSTIQAINAINIKTGVILGAVGVRSTADADGIWSQRPHVGFYVNPGTLLWVAEENRSSDGNTITYSIFYELREGDPVNQPLYTILAFDGSWHRTTQTFMPNSTAKAGQYLKIMTEAERQLERQFHRDRQLQPDHIQDLFYRRQLEAMTSELVEEFISHAADSGAVRDYLNQLLNFVRQQEALRDAPIGDRERITFIMGDVRRNVQQPDVFYIHANDYFSINPAGTVVTHLRTLVDVRDYLSNNSTNNGLPWGEVNIVVHANEEGGMSIPVRPGGREVTPDHLEKAVSDGEFRSLSNSKMDVRTEIRIRGCALGQSQRMLHQLSVAFGNDDLQRPIVRAPIHLQGYSGPQGNGPIVSVDEFPVEFWFVGWAGSAAAQPNQATLIAAFRAKYGDLDFDWAAALQQQIPNITLAERDRSSFSYTYSYTYDPSDPPNIGTSSAARLAWLQANSDGDFDADLARSGRTASDYQWSFTSNTTTESNGQKTLHLIASGIRTILRLQRNVRGRLIPQFNIDTTLQATLTARTVSQALRDTFAANNMPLSERAEISILDINRRWMIQDPIYIRTFIINFINNQLSVSLEQDFLPTEPVVRIHPPATDLRHFGEEVPARPADHPLGENVQP